VPKTVIEIMVEIGME